MKRIPAISRAWVFLCLLSFTASGQTKEWVWLNGSNLRNELGVYGIRGVAAAGNKPGARYGGITWKDAAGNFWLFGGYGYGQSGSAGYLNDLWRFAPGSRMWTWVSGDNTTGQYGTYGTKGAAAATNKPGGRVSGVGFTDAAGNFFIYGGYGYATFSAYNAGYLNDLWKFDPVTGQWTWVQGDNNINMVAVYGTKGTPAAANKPGSRQAATAWKDNNGNILLYGGNGYINTTANTGTLGDLWQYNTSTGQWVWLSGDNTLNQLPVFGTKGTAAAANKPGARTGAQLWVNADGSVMMFGGSGMVGHMSDIWKYDLATGLWTWINGDNTGMIKGVYSTVGVEAAANKPGGRYNFPLLKDASGNIWVLGGSGMVTTGTGILSDIWKYNPATNLWTWVAGDGVGNNYGNYGTLGTGSSSSIPGARSGSMSWMDASGKIWLLGGQGYSSVAGIGPLNDFWGYARVNGFSSTLPVSFSYFAARYQSGQVVLNWTTAQEQNSRDFVVERSANGINYDPVGIIAASGNSSRPINYTFTDGRPLTGVSYYRLKQSDLDGRFMYSKVASVSIDGEKHTISLLHNPVYNSLPLTVDMPATQKMTLLVRNSSGLAVMKKEQVFVKGSSRFDLLIDNLAQGVYYLTVSGPGASSTLSFIRE